MEVAPELKTYNLLLRNLNSKNSMKEAGEANHFIPFFPQQKKNKLFFFVSSIEWNEIGGMKKIL